MDKEKLVKLKGEAEATCRVLYDQLETAKAQAAQLEVELERARGDFRTYGKLLDEWQDPAPTPAHPLMPVADATPTPKKEKSSV